MPKLLLGALTLLFTLLFLALAAGAPQEGMIEIPKSIQLEHTAIHASLAEATKVQGAVGSTAKALAEALHSHLEREEEIALPPLGLLAPLADGLPIPEAQLSAALAASESLRKELPQLLGEHARIIRAIDAFRDAAKAQHLDQYVELADKVALHAQSEEEILYPAAILVADVIRAKQKAG